MSLTGELTRRGVIRVGLTYLAASWLLIQIADTVFPAFGLPTTALTALIILLAVGCIPAVILSWKFELTAGGLQPDRGVTSGSEYSHRAARYLDRTITVLLVMGIAYFAVDKFVVDPARDAARIEAARQEGRADIVIESYGEKSIAVLPFVNMSAEPEQEYFSDGLAEEILNLLARVEGLRVISRSSSFAFKGTNIRVTDVAKDLNVAHVLEGSVRKSGNKIRITAQLIEARSDTHLWSETYDRELDDIFSIQDEIAAAVTEQLKITLVGDAPKALRADAQAYALYLHARYLINTLTAESRARAKPLIEQALEIDPTYVPVLIQRLRLEVQENDDWATSPLFHELVDRIVAVDPYNERALSVQSWVALYVHHDVVSAARFLERAMSQPSTDVEFLRGTSTILNGLGMNDEAMAVSAYVVDRDPTCLQCRYHLARAYRTAGLFGEAEAMMQSAVDLLPEDSAFGFALASTQLMNGKAQAALDWVEAEVDRNSPQMAALRVMALHDLGRVVEYRTALDDLLQEAGEEQPWQVAQALAWTGDIDRAFHFLSSPGADERFFDTTSNSPFLSRLHDDPRWQALLKRHGIATEQIQALDIKIRLPPGVTVN